MDVARRDVKISKTYSNGDIYEGEMLNGKRHGQGKNEKRKLLFGVWNLLCKHQAK
jgi:hypothetical protein